MQPRYGHSLFACAAIGCTSCVYAGVSVWLFLCVQLHSCVYAANLRSGLIFACVTMFLRLCGRSPFFG